VVIEAEGRLIEMLLNIDDFLIVTQYRVVEHYRRLLTGPIPDLERSEIASRLAVQENELDRLRKEAPISSH
jgi:hypothetical protein